MSSINVTFKPSKKQFEAWSYLMDNNTEFIGYGGSGFSGKTWLMCYWVTTMSLAYPDTAYGLGRRELTNLKRTSLITLFKVFKECGITESHYKYNQQLNTITFWNKSQIFLIDTAYKPSDPLYTRFGGYELTSCCIDESAETEQEAIDILYTRTNRRNNGKYGLKRKMLETFNPAKNHVHSRYYTPNKLGILPDSYVFIKALPKDNPSPEVDEYVAGILKNSNEITIQRLVYGNFDYDDDENSLVSYASIQAVFMPESLYIDIARLTPRDMFLTIDVARLGKDKSVIMIWKKLTVIKIITIPVCTITELAVKCKEITAKYKIPSGNIIADESGVGGGLVDILGCKGFISNAKPLNKDNYNHIKSQCSYRLAKEISLGTISIYPTPYKLAISEELEQLKSYKSDSDGKLQIVPKDIVKRLIGRSPDYSDTLLMRMYFLVKKRSGEYTLR